MTTLLDIRSAEVRKLAEAPVKRDGVTPTRVHQTRAVGSSAMGSTIPDDIKGSLHISLPPSPRERAVELVLSQYKASTNLLAYIDAYMEELAELTTAMISTYVYRYPSLAFGKMLDTVAEIVGVGRRLTGAAPLGLFGFYEEAASLGFSDATMNIPTGGVLRSDGESIIGDLLLTDEELRRYIQAKILINTQTPSVDNMYKYTDYLYGSSDTRWELQEGYAAGSSTPTANMHFDGYLTVQERAFFAAVYLRFKVLGVAVTMSDLSGNIILQEGV